jgi:hypothetical protein
MAVDCAHQAAQESPDFCALGPLGRAQYGGDEAALVIEHDNGLEAVFVMMGIEQAQLLAAVDSVEGVINVEHNALGHCGEAFAIQIDHRTPHAQQRPGIGQVLQTGDGRLRTQRAGPRGCQIERHLEHRIDAQAGCIIAILIACSDHHQPEPDDVGKAMRDVLGRARILDTGRQTIGHAKALLDLAQQQNPAIR